MLVLETRTTASNTSHMEGCRSTRFQYVICDDEDDNGMVAEAAASRAKRTPSMCKRVIAGTLAGLVNAVRRPKLFHTVGVLLVACSDVLVCCC